MRLTATLFTILIFCIHGFAYAQSVESEDVFFAVLPDVPVMDGMTEISDAALSFDKPDGRIVHVVAAIHDLDSQHIISFYRTALRQLGWREISSHHFMRGREEIRFFLDTDPNHGAIMRMIVTPHL